MIDRASYIHVHLSAQSDHGRHLTNLGSLDLANRLNHLLINSCVRLSHPIACSGAIIMADDWEAILSQRPLQSPHWTLCLKVHF